MKLSLTYLLNASSIGRSILFAPTLLVTVTVPEMPREEMNETALVSFHCKKKNSIDRVVLDQWCPSGSVFWKVHYFSIPSFAIRANNATNQYLISFSKELKQFCSSVPIIHVDFSHSIWVSRNARTQYCIHYCFCESSTASGRVDVSHKSLYSCSPLRGTQIILPFTKISDEISWLGSSGESINNDFFALIHLLMKLIRFLVCLITQTASAFALGSITGPLTPDSANSSGESPPSVTVKFGATFGIISGAGRFGAIVGMILRAGSVGTRLCEERTL